MSAAEPLTTSKDFEMLLEFIKHNRGFDFTGYKRSSLMRRFHKRMTEVGVSEYGDYMDYLEVHPEEFNHLFNTILINVTAFFRDTKAWEYIDQYIIPRLIGSKKPGEQIRIWSAGCASGEEAYTIAILMAEHLGIEGFKEKVKVYATDIDEEALAKARAAVYAEQELAEMPADLREKYFERTNGRYAFHKELRRCIIFGRHDLIQDAPISRIDLLICRNVLMYFNSETQGRILTRLNYALAEGGILFLGKAEMLLSRDNLFTPVELKNRIFTKVHGMNMRERLLAVTQSNNEIGSDFHGYVRIRDAAFDSGPVAQVVIDSNGYLILANERARALFGLSLKDLGRLFQDLELSYRPIELRSSIDQAYARRATMTIDEVEAHFNSAEPVFLKIVLTPLQQNNVEAIGVCISFFDITEYKRLQRQLEHSNQELETAMEELQSTNEELETTNEELQSTIEELETTNEELQSTNEELETMNEELQSTNEELETMNDEMTQGTLELNRINSFLESILTSLRGGVIVVDQEMNVQTWNKKAEDLWGLREDEVLGMNLFNIDFGLPVDQMRKNIRSVMSGEVPSSEIEVAATNRRGRAIRCEVICTPLLDHARHVQGVIMMIEQKGVITE